jgi:hypothetical protein
MSYLNQNYFNNFQVKNPILKNPVNRNCPLQLQKVRPSQLATGASANQTLLIVTEDITCSALRVNPGYTNTNYILPSANQLITWLGVQSNGLPTPTYTSTVQAGDILIIPVINTAQTGCNIVAGANTTGSNESTGCFTVPARISATKPGSLNQLVIDFNYVSSGSQGVTGSYLVYGIAATGTQ